MHDLQCYLVGGAVRDALLSRPVRERDWVVVGATRDSMLARGFRQVGRDFPVFLHPQTGEEYALARTERKQGLGHVGFVVHAAPDVTLVDDLRRRDLTINAIAQRDDGELVDPYGGVADLRARMLRHVSPAFVEDPLRVFRVARFAGQLGGFGFSVAPETRALMAQIAHSGELALLSAERVWAELAKALSCGGGQQFLAVLRDADAIAPWFTEWLDAEPAEAAPAPELDDASGVSAVPVEADLPSRYAAFCANLSLDALQSANRRLKPPRTCIDLARLLVAERNQLVVWQTLSPEALLNVLQRCDALRRPERFGVLCDLIVELGATGAAGVAAFARSLASLPLDLPSSGDVAASVRAQRLLALAHWPRVVEGSASAR